MAFLGAVGDGDAELMKEILTDLAEYPKVAKVPEAALAAELTKVAMMQVLRAPFREPDWLRLFELSRLPAEWRSSAALLALNRMIWHGETARAAVLAEVMTGFSTGGAPAGSYPEVVLLLNRARIAHDELRMDEARKWAKLAVRSAKLGGVIYPFLGKALSPKSPLQQAFAEEAPDLFAKIKALNADFFRNLVKLHNRHTGEKLVETLTPRAFYLACALKRGVRYKEIAERMGVTYSRVNNMVTELFETLNVRQAEELNGKVW